MAVNRIKIGNIIEIVDERNSDGSISVIYGININKEFMPTVANTDGIDPKKYKIVRRNRFVFSGMQTGRDECIRIGLYTEEKPFIVSPAYTTFEIIRQDLIINKYFFMNFLSTEMDRYGLFLSDSSIRSNLDWDRFCEIEMELPSLSIQQKYVDVYDSLLLNQKIYEKGLDDLKLTCDAYIEQLRRNLPMVEIGPYIQAYYEIYNGKQLIPRRGISIAKKFVIPKQEQNSARSSQIVRVGQFAYNTATTRNGETLSIAYCNNEECAVPGIYQVFEIIEKQKLMPEYLFMWFCRSEFDRYTRWISQGSAHEQFILADMKKVKIPIPVIGVQQAIVNIFNVYNERKVMVEKLKRQMKNICPILVKGAVGEN
jgi:type I restriction enzyme S subunit